MTYSESAIGLTISHDRAIKELNMHGIFETIDFYADMGEKTEYVATAVLQWLGY